MVTLRKSYFVGERSSSSFSFCYALSRCKRRDRHHNSQGVLFIKLELSECERDVVRLGCEPRIAEGRRMLLMRGNRVDSFGAVLAQKQF